MDDKFFKKRLRTMGLTAEDIASRAGRSRTAVSHILNGRQRMSLEWAEAFAETLDMTVDEVFDKAGRSFAVEGPTAATPGFSEGDAAPWRGPQNDSSNHEALARISAFGGGRPGVDVWRVKGAAMQMMGYVDGDFMLVDTHQSELAKPGDVVVAQVYDMSAGNATTVLRRYDPPMLTASTADPQRDRPYVVDGNAVVIRGKVIASWRA